VRIPMEKVGSVPGPREARSISPRELGPLGGAIGGGRRP
jgi:hypothetical protein